MICLIAATLPRYFAVFRADLPSAAVVICFFAAASARLGVTRDAAAAAAAGCRFRLSPRATRFSAADARSFAVGRCLRSPLRCRAGRRVCLCFTVEVVYRFCRQRRRLVSATPWGRRCCRRRDVDVLSLNSRRRRRRARFSAPLLHFSRQAAMPHSFSARRRFAAAVFLIDFAADAFAQPPRSSFFVFACRRCMSCRADATPFIFAVFASRYDARFSRLPSRFTACRRFDSVFAA